MPNPFLLEALVPALNEWNSNHSSPMKTSPAAPVWSWNSRFPTFLNLIFLLGLWIPGSTFAEPAARVLVEHDGIAYFMRQTPGRLQRYDIRNRSWLSSISLPDNPTALAADGDGFYVAYGEEIYRYNPSFDGEIFLRSIDQAAHELFTDGDLLLVDSSTSTYGHYTTMDKFSGALVQSKSEYIDNTHGTVLSRSLNRMIGVCQGILPADLTMVTYDEDGYITTIIDSPYHGDYPVGSRLWISPRETRIVDSTGIMYNTLDLSYAVAVDGDITSVSFNEDLPIILRGSRLQSYNKAYLPAGAYQLPAPADEILVEGEDVIVFTHPEFEAEDVTAQVIPLSELNAPDPNEPLSPEGLPYQPDAVFEDNGTVIMVDFESAMVFTWSVGTRSYSGSFILQGNPILAAYSRELNRLYLTYRDNLLTKVDMDAGEPVEEIFAEPPNTIQGMAAAGTLLVIQDSGIPERHRIYNSEGIETDAAEWKRYSRVYEWDPVHRRLYFFRDTSVPRDLEWEEISVGGRIVAEGESPYNGEVICEPPIFAFDKGSNILLGSGQVFASDGLTEIGSLPEPVVSAAWLPRSLFTVVKGTSPSSWETVELNHSLLQRWTADFEPDGNTSVPGSPLRLLDTEGRLLLISMEEGIPRFSLFDAGLRMEWSSIGTDSGVGVTDIQPGSARLNWDGSSLEDRKAAIERFQFDTGEWEKIITVDASDGTYQLDGLEPGSDHMYRVVLETSTEVQPISGGVNPENSGFLHSEVFFYNILDAMTFQKEEPDGSWSDVDAIAVSPYNYMMETGLAPLTPFNYRALQEVEIKQLVDSISIDLLQLDIEWELIDGTYPVLVYRYTGNSTSLYRTLAMQYRMQFPG